MVYHPDILSSKYTATITSGTQNSATVVLPDVLQFMQLLWAVVHGMERRSKRMSGAIGITGPQRLVLRVAGLSPGLSAGDLATILHVHPSTLTGVLQRLVDQRLLVRLNDPHDRRKAVLTLTAHGRRVNAKGHGTVESAVAEALEAISPRDRAATTRVLERLATHLDQADPDSRRTPGGHRRNRRTNRSTAGG